MNLLRIFKSTSMFLGIGICCALLLMPSAKAQVVNGSISGTVIDPSGAVIAGATVTAVNAETSASSTAATTSSGAFLIAGLAVGTYNLTVTKSGFQTTVQAGVTVTAAADHGVGTIKMAVGSSSTTVEVSGAPPLLESTQAQVSTAITNTQMTAFPGLNANSGLDNMAVYLPGINMTRDTTFTNTNGVGFSSNGLRGRSNDQQVDGQNNNDNSIGGPQLFVSSPLFVQEYQVITDNFGPEYGRNSASVVNEVTKQGTNVWHGTILGTESNNYVDALSNIQKVDEGLTGPPRFNDEFTGGSIGGPIWKNKIFVFGGFDNEIVSSTNLFIDGSQAPDATGLGEMAACAPTSTAAQGFVKFSAFALGASPVPGTTKQNVVAAPGGGTCTIETAEPERLLPNGSHEWDWDYRMDAVVSDTDRFFGRYLFQKQDFINAFGDAAAGYPVNVPSLGQSILLDETHTFTSTMVNDFRIGFQRANVQFGTNSTGTVPGIGGLTNAVTQVTIDENGAVNGTVFQGFGLNADFPQGRIISTWQGQDNWSFLQGKNEWLGGVNYTYQRSINSFFPGINGTWDYASLAAVLANTPDVVSGGIGNPVLDFREHDLFLYGGDNLKLRSNLTLNLGLTWTYFGSPENLFHTLTTENETGPTPLFDPSLPLSVRTAPEIPSEKNLFGPSVGFAWTPRVFGRLTGGDKTVIRGGYRLTVDPAYYNVFLNVSTSSPNVLLNTLEGAAASGFVIPADPVGSNVRVALASAIPVGQTDPRDSDQETIPNNFGADKVHEWSLGIQRQITPHLVAESRYVGNHGFDLWQSVNANPLVSNLAAAFPSVVPSGVTACPAGNAVVPNAVGRENCNEGILLQVQNTGYSDYEGWQNELHANGLFHNQLTLIGNYTWSKTTDNTTDIFNTFAGGNSETLAQDPFNIAGAEHGISGLDFPQQFTVQGYWNVPLYRSQHGVMGHALGGWSVGIAYQLVSGQPYTPIQEVLNTFTGGVSSDAAFNAAFNNGVPDTARPFLGNTSAPANQVGIFAGDACLLEGLSANCGLGQNLAANSLISLNQFNTSGAATPVQNSQVHYIANGAEADSIFGTPFGNVTRNSARDFHTNLTNITVFRTFKFSERVNLQARLDMLNAFNHPNFSSVDPFIDHAGLSSFATGFGQPNLFGDGPRVMKAGLQITF